MENRPHITRKQLAANLALAGYGLVDERQKVFWIRARLTSGRELNGFIRFRDVAGDRYYNRNLAQCPDTKLTAILTLSLN
jgi:hypothetical protein